MYVGSDKQPLDVIFDTGSNWFWVKSVDCDNCPYPDSFNHKTSDTFSTYGRDITLTYGSGSVSGVVSQDEVCLDKNHDEHCVPDFHFVNVMHQ